MRALRSLRENRSDARGLGAHRQHFECATALGAMLMLMPMSYTRRSRRIYVIAAYADATLDSWCGYDARRGALASYSAR